METVHVLKVPHISHLPPLYPQQRKSSCMNVRNSVKKNVCTNLFSMPGNKPIHEKKTHGSDCNYSPGQHQGSIIFYILKVPLGSDKNVLYIGFTSPTGFNKKFSELNYNYKHYFTISSYIFIENT